MPSLRSLLVRKFVRLRIKHLLHAGVPVDKVRRRTNYLASYGWYHHLVRTERVQIGSMPAALFAPRGGDVRGSLLFLHGGGYCFGSIKMYRDLAARLSAACRARVLLPEYRLTPENAFPAPLEDARAAWQWLLDHGAQAESLALGGDSAGGGLALALAMSLRDAGQPLPRSLICLSPWTDLACTGETLQTHGDLDPMLPADGIRECAARYTSGRDPRNPLLSPLYGNLEGLPPLYIQVGTHEVLLSDAQRLADAARDAGVETTIEVWDSMWHVWHLFAWCVPEAKQAIRKIGAFVQQHWETATEPANVTAGDNGTAT